MDKLPQSGNLDSDVAVEIVHASADLFNSSAQFLDAFTIRYNFSEESTWLNWKHREKGGPMGSTRRLSVAPFLEAVSIRTVVGRDVPAGCPLADLMLRPILQFRLLPVIGTNCGFYALGNAHGS